ncbi:MAG: glycosyltransferase [Anaerolineae bacterium]|nr:glycosyltransferase [Anaerolineae bacterium]
MRVLWIAPANQPYIDDGPLSTTDFLSCAWKAFNERGATQYALLPPSSSCSAFANASISSGTFQPDALLEPNAPDGTALPRMIEVVERISCDFDVVINLGHDVLPHKWMMSTSAKVFSIPNLCHQGRPTDQVIKAAVSSMPGRFLWSSRYQMASFGVGKGVVAFQPFDLRIFPEHDGEIGDYLLFAGHLIPEKGLLHAARVAQKLGKRLLVCGGNSKSDYIKECLKINPDIEFLGQVSRTVLFGLMAGAIALLQFQETPEAFGRVTAEALLCGCPVIFRDAGATCELVSQKDGDGIEVDMAMMSLQRIEAYLSSPIDRAAIQTRAMERFSPSVWANKLTQMILQDQDISPAVAA